VEIVFGQDGKALAKAPAMTLHPGGLVKRERGKEEELRRKQKKKQRASHLNSRGERGTDEVEETTATTAVFRFQAG
jgi:hypothetical protein